MRKFLAAAALAALATPVLAQGQVTVSQCDWLESARVIPEPWERHTTTFYNGQVRIYVADSIEPACCWAHLVILLPDPDSELGERKCVAVNGGNMMGYGDIDFARIEASYDPAEGLTIRFPYALYIPETGETGPFTEGRVLIDLSRGSVTPR